MLVSKTIHRFAVNDFFQIQSKIIIKFEPEVP